MEKFHQQQMRRKAHDYYKAEQQLRYNLLTELLLGRFEEFADHLGIEILANAGSFFGPCPIHNGDRITALNIYRDGDVPGKWMCFTHKCEQYFKRTLLGFVRGVLSNKKLGWNTNNQKLYDWSETILYCCDFLGVAWSDIQVDSSEVARQKLIRDVNGWGSPVGAHGQACGQACNQENALCSKQYLNDSLVMPSQYFCERNFTENILKKFSVGDCVTPSRQLFGRAVVPVIRGNYVLGVSARSIYEECARCKLWHDGDCPPAHMAGNCTKWRHMPRGFHIGQHLYNAENALPFGKVLVVEGPGCVWRLAEAGINAVGTFGASLTDAQQILLEVAGCREIYCGFDNDEAGETGFEKMTKDMGKICRVRRLKPPAHDWGEMSAGEVRQIVSSMGFKEFKL